MVSSSHRRRPRTERTSARRPVRGPLLAVAAVAAVALVATLVVAFRPGGAAGIGRGAADRAVSAASASPSSSPEAAGSATATAPPAPSKGASAKPAAGARATPTRSAAAAPARRTATGTARTPATTTVPAAGRIRPGASHQGVATSYDVRRRRRLLVRPDRRRADRGDEHRGLRDGVGVRRVRLGPCGGRHIRHRTHHQRMPRALRGRPTRPEPTGVRLTGAALGGPGRDHLEAAEPGRLRHGRDPLQDGLHPLLVRDPGDRSPQPAGPPGGPQRAAAGWR